MQHKILHEILVVNELKIINLFAGKRPDGQDVVEQIRVKPLENKHYCLVQSPAFVQGLASGDEIRYDDKDNSFELIRHSGNLCVRVFTRDNISAIKEDLRAPIEKLGGELDYDNERMLIMSIHFSCGFTELEQILNKTMAKYAQAAWFYGNVYDPSDGKTPLNWWVALEDV